MKRMLSCFLVTLLLLSLLCGCGPTGEAGSNGAANSTAQNGNGAGQGTSDSAAPADTDFSQTSTDMFTDRDGKDGYDADGAVHVQLNGSSATADSDSVTIVDSTVQLTEEATYVITGQLTDGMLVVNAPDTAKLQLVFNGVSVTSESSAALYILQADKVFLTLADDTDNRLANGGSFTAIDDNNIDAALFSKEDLTVNGSGSLTVVSPVGHGIVCKDDLVLTGGTVTVNAASHGVDANDSVRIANAALSIDAGKDLIHVENTEDSTKGFVYMESGSVTGEAEGDGITASATIQIEGGRLELLVGGGAENGTKASSGNYGDFMGGGPGGGMPPGGMGHGGRSAVSQSTTTATDAVSMKGLKAAGGLLISDGAITIDSADDSLHADRSVTINGGTLTLASGDDAIHAEETLTVTAGTITISECYEGLEALHVDVRGGSITLTASDDGLNAAGGTDASGTEGGRDGAFGGGPGGWGGPGGSAGSSNGSITISGGTLYIRSSGDGVDANGTLEISGGHTTVVGPTQGDTATLDFDTSGVITGGTFIGTGASGMAQTFSDSAQGVVALRVGNQAAGTEIVLQSTDGSTLLTHTPELDFAVVILSSPALVKGETYTVKIGSETAEFQAS